MALFIAFPYCVCWQLLTSHNDSVLRLSSETVVCVRAISKALVGKLHGVVTRVNLEPVKGYLLALSEWRL